MKGAYYNEFDPKAAAWLRELIRRNLIAPGDVDERSIEDVRPAELAGYSQCHFFAGIGVWSYALRRAGVEDNRRIWTGSCPCQPLSQAGKGRGFDDERHLWPAWYHLIDVCRPPSIFGEQVASKAADSWADLVQDDVEALGYAFGAVPFPAASVGAPHIRDRLYWCAVADNAEQGRIARRRLGEESDGRNSSRLESGRLRDAGDGLADTDGGHAGAEREQRSGQHGQQQEDDGTHERLADDDDDARRIEHAQRNSEPFGGRQATSRGDDTGGCGKLGDTGGGGSGRHTGEVSRTESRAERRVWCEFDEPESSSGDSLVGHHHHAGLERRGLPAGGRAGECTPWSASDFVWCRDGKWRPVEPGTFPLAHGAPARVGRLRGYGNAIVSEAAKVFIEASGLV